MEPDCFILNSIKYSNIKLTTIEVVSKAFMVVPKLQIIPSKISHDVNDLLRWEFQQLSKLLDSLQNEKRKLSRACSQFYYVERI